MAGGIGSRFWPKSRVCMPKQFLDILGVGKTLLQMTYDRFTAIVPKENIFIISVQEYKSKIKEQLPDVLETNIVLEPYRRNTAPCVAYISFKINQIDPDATLLITPSDHLLVEQEKFEQLCAKAFDFVNYIDGMVTLGIQPTDPTTGYGYIQYERMPVAQDIYKVKTFTEKPNTELAKTFISSGDFLWNAGIFIWRAKTILNAFEEHQPEIYEYFENIKEMLNTPKEAEFIETTYSLCPTISIDYAIMEKATNVYIIPCALGWSDLGVWNSIYENSKQDTAGNVVLSDYHKTINCKNNLISLPNNKLIVVEGLENMIVIDTPDVLLICNRNKEQEVKTYVQDIKKINSGKFL
ncbi:MAG: mannose-1-phosphate guanylyltransferase [Phycisphaerales bacterium]|nr:mannose-1-phosphate guanylyltransferase [Phycisphaerales bacterium]